MSEPAIRNWKNQPPAGGWPFSWTSPTGRKFLCDAYSPGRCVDKLRDVQKLNHWYVSEAHLWAIANDEWRKKDPERAIWSHSHPKLDVLPTAAQLKPVRSEQPPARQSWWEAKPAEWGARAWSWLHLHGAFFGSRESFMATVQRIEDILNPHKSPDLGCIDCFNEFREIRRRNNPENVGNEQQAAAWSFDAHNAVNTRRGVVPMRWSTAAKIHHWKVSLE